MPSTVLAVQNTPTLVPGTYAVDHILVGDVAGKMYQVPLAEGVTVEQALTTYRAQSGVSYAEPDWIVHATVIPSDPSFSQEYGLNNTGQSINGGPPGTPDADIDAPETWNVTVGSATTVVADIDTGIDYNHPDLYLNIWINQQEIPTAIRSALTDTDGDGLITFYDLNDPVNQGAGTITDLNGDGRIDGGDLLNNASGWENGIDDDGDGKIDDLIGWDFVNNDNDPMDDNGHGTHTAGTIGAIGNNGVGVSGVDWHVQIAAMKFLSAAGSGDIANAKAALDLAVAKGILISNNSWAGGGYSQAFKDSLDAAAAAGHIFVAAAGNASSNNDLTPSYPASYASPNIIAVAATDNNDMLASFSNFGTQTVDIAAPGVDVLSTLPNNSYGYFSGTSMATPHVTGVVALVRSENPSLTYSQVIDQILSNADVLPGLTNKVAGERRLNAFGAVTGAPPPPPAGPSVLSSTPNGSVPPSIGFVDFNFNAAMSTGSFSLSDDVSSFTGPGGINLLGALNGFSWQDSDTLRVTFTAQSTEGSYSMTIGPQILRASDNAAMDQDGDSIPGEPTDQYTANFSIANVLTFRSTDVPAPIVSAFEFVSDLTVNQHITVGDLNVQLNIRMLFDDDLDIYLQSPAGTMVSLSQFEPPQSGSNFQDTIFDDQASLSISQGHAPFLGSYRPETPLSAINGQDAFGTWHLIIDNWPFYGFDDGTLNAWSIIVRPQGTPGNQPPNAVDDTATTSQNTPVKIAVLANDSDPNNDALTVTAVTQGTKGTATTNADNTVTYTPNANVTGTDTFQYTISDGKGGTDTATVTVTISGANNPPVAVNDSATTLEDNAVTIAVLANDSDPNGDALSVIGVTQGTKGTVAINANNTVTYSPNPNANGNDSFQYGISDGHGGTATATVNVTITPVNDPPVAVNNAVSTLEDTPVTVAVLANDSDPDGDALSVIGVTQATKGTVVINANNTVTYSPNQNANGNDSFQYTISDGHGGLASAAVTVTITPVNDPPLAVNDSAVTGLNTPVTVAVLANDSDPDGDALSVTGVTQGAKGTVVINASNTVTYTPNLNAGGNDSFQYTISDGHGGTATASVNITITTSSVATTTTLVSSVNPSVLGQAVTFTATVTTIPLGLGDPTGAVTFRDRNKTLATVSLDGSGRAVFTTSSLTQGTHQITAVYGGNATLLSSTSPALAQVVKKGSSGAALATTSLTTSQASILSSAMSNGSTSTLDTVTLDVLFKQPTSREIDVSAPVYLSPTQWQDIAAAVVSQEQSHRGVTWAANLGLTGLASEDYITDDMLQQLLK